jgi:hypothetical protein
MPALFAAEALVKLLAHGLDHHRHREHARHHEYVLAILAIMLFRENGPWHWRNLHHAMFTLFRCATLED